MSIGLQCAYCTRNLSLGRSVILVFELQNCGTECHRFEWVGGARGLRAKNLSLARTNASPKPKWSLIHHDEARVEAEWNRATPKDNAVVPFQFALSWCDRFTTVNGVHLVPKAGLLSLCPCSCVNCVWR